MKWQRNGQGEKGFTLIELMVGLLIAGILMATVTSVLLISQKVYTRGGDISYKVGTVTNTETNLQNYLSVATGVILASAPKTDDEESYSIGFKADGTGEEVIMSSVIDSSGNKKYSKTVIPIPHLSEIDVQATGVNTITLNYQLVPKDTTMSTLSGGMVMNNINIRNNNRPSQEKLLNGTKLYDSDDQMHYLVLTFEETTGGTVVPGTGINDMLERQGIEVGSWDKLIDFASKPIKQNDPHSYTFSSDENGSVYSDSTGTYVTANSKYVGTDYVDKYKTAEEYCSSFSGGDIGFLKISETTRVITAADYETDPTKNQVWKDGLYPQLGDLYLYPNELNINELYIFAQQQYSDVDRVKDPRTGHGWLKLIDAKPEFR